MIFSAKLSDFSAWIEEAGLELCDFQHEHAAVFFSCEEAAFGAIFDLFCS